MEILKTLFFKVVAPILWLAIYACVFTFSATKLEKAWKSKNLKLIWLYLWIILVGVYFLFYGGR